MTPRTLRRAALGAATLVAAASLATPAIAAKPTTLTGTFKLKAGAASGGKVTGSYFQMIGPDGKPFANPSSTAPDPAYTSVRPGSDGGLVTGRYQPAPKSAFDDNGNSLAARIIKPQSFAGIGFGLTTLAADPTTAAALPKPTVTLKGTKLTARLGALTAEWNRLTFNQGATAKGTYKKKTKAFVLAWKSTISGGPFNGFTGSWHLEGTFKKR